MSVLLALLGFAAVLVLMVVKALAVDQVKGQIQRRIRASVEATIASLPDELQREWAEEWRGELAAVITMPLTAARLARGLRRSACELVADTALAPAGIAHHAPQPGSRPIRSRLVTHSSRLVALFPRPKSKWLSESVADRVFGVVISVVGVVGVPVGVVGGVVGVFDVFGVGGVSGVSLGVSLVVSSVAIVTVTRRLRAR